ncbi:ATP-binding protein [Malonomonas rubra]|uniref:ATP-binding protein n=1 Tax=Malonomonas rubra TaxID=57040 RepID=UPI0026EE22B6|nr:ATP-binding protein [Malonomonas rubra]
MANAPFFKTKPAIIFLLVGIASLTAVGLSLAYLVYNIDSIQQLIVREMGNQYQIMALNSPLEKVIFDLEQDVQNVAVHSNEDLSASERSSQHFLQEIADLRGDFDLIESTEQRQLRLELLSDYGDDFTRYAMNNIGISQLFSRLHETHQFFLDHLDAMEEKTGQKMIEYTLSGKDPLVLRQMFAIIPLCREHVLKARYLIEVEISGRGGMNEPENASAEETLSAGALEILRQALDTLTDGFDEISRHADVLLARIPAYATDVAQLQSALVQQRSLRSKLNSSRAELIAVLQQSRDKMLKNMDHFPTATESFSRRALLVSYGVSAVVLSIFMLAWLVMRRVSRRMERSMHAAIDLKQELQEKNQALLQEMAARERDEESRKELEAQLRHSHKMEAIGTLAGGVAHDFNNILAAVLGYTELAIMRAGQGRDNGAALAEIKKASIRAKNLIGQILAFSRRSEQNFSPVSLGPVISEAVMLLRSTLPTTIELKLTLDESADGLVVLADQTQIHQIVMNLCTNAFHAMRQCGGRLDVDLKKVDITSSCVVSEGDSLPVGSYCRILVKDTGEGIDTHLVERIFEPYFTTKVRGEGTGMGLAMVHGIVQAHNGRINCQSTLGVGTSFEVLLPLVCADQIIKGTYREEEPIGGHEHILLVDDEVEVIEAHRQMLCEIGYRVSVAVNGLEALTCFEVQPDQFDLVLTDMTMPRMTGAELAVKLLEIRPDLPILMFTGFSDSIDERRSRQLGIGGFLLKPVSFEDMARNIRQLLDQSSRDAQSRAFSAPGAIAGA